MKDSSLSKLSSIWEIHCGEELMLASNLLLPLIGNDDKKNFLKKDIAKRPDYYLCGACNTQIHISDSPNQIPYIKHRSAKSGDTIQKSHNACPFYTNKDKHLLSKIYNGEGRWHFETKHQLARLLENDQFVNNTTRSVDVEKYILGVEENTRRQPDISFYDIKGNKWAMELTNNWMNPSIAVEREKFFTENNIKAIWLLSPKCSDIKHSMLRFVLFGMSGDPIKAEHKYGHFNAFSISAETLSASMRKKELLLDFLCPTFNSSLDGTELEYSLKPQAVSLKEMKFQDGNIYPYISCQRQNYKIVREKIDKNIREKNDLDRKKKAAEKRKSTAIYEDIRYLLNRFLNESDSDAANINYLKSNLETSLNKYKQLEYQSIKHQKLIDSALSELDKLKDQEALERQKEIEEKIKQQEAKKQQVATEIDSFIDELKQGSLSQDIGVLLIKGKRLNNSANRYGVDSHICFKLCEAISDFKDSAASKLLNELDCLQYPIDVTISYKELLKKAVKLSLGSEGLNIPNNLRSHCEDIINTYLDTFTLNLIQEIVTTHYDLNRGKPIDKKKVALLVGSYKYLRQENIFNEIIKHTNAVQDLACWYKTA